MSTATWSTVVGVFNKRDDADRAIDGLVKSGFRNDQIGVVTREAKGTTVVEKQDEAESHAGSGAIVGAAAGAGIGGLVGLGVLAGFVPVIGPAIAAGTLATILTNAAGGAAVAGLSGALIGWGLPEEHAGYYDGQLQAGRIVVTVQAEDRCDSARTILRNHGGYNHDSEGKPSTRI